MLLTLTTTHNPATDLGYLLHKNPAKLHSFELSFGKAHVFYPEATAERCTAALLLDVDPVGLVRGKLDLAWLLHACKTPYRHQCGALGTSHPQSKYEFRLTLTSNRGAGGAVVEPPA